MVVAVPGVGFDWEGVVGVGCPLVMAVDYLDVFENIRRVHYWVFGAPDMRHVAPVVRSWADVSYYVLKIKRNQITI